VIYLIGMNSTDLMSQSGIGTVRMQLSESNYTEIQAPVAPVTVTYTPNADNDFSLAWQNYFTNTLKWQETGIGVYQLPPTDTLVIKRYDIMIKSLS
jgi:hypothetical protein